MTFIAMRLSFVFGAGPFTAQYVNRFRNQLQMIQINTRSITARMVKFKTKRNIPNKMPIDSGMSVLLTTVDFDTGIALGSATVKRNASVWLNDKSRQKPFNE